MVFCLPKFKVWAIVFNQLHKKSFLVCLFTKKGFSVVDGMCGCRTFFIFSVKIGSHHFNSNKSRFKKVFINGKFHFFNNPPHL